VDEERKQAVFEELAGMSPLRATGKPNDIALAMLYLAADASKYVTGQVLRPNGGGSMV
jgi:3-oxoacyl-[acyl-carrier protein] reductase